MEVALKLASFTTAQARERFAELINRAAFANERIVITRHGKPLAEISAVSELDFDNDSNGPATPEDEDSPCDTLSERFPRVTPEAIARISEQHGIREISIFGSSLRRDFRSDSDVDLLIEMEPNRAIGFFGLHAIEAEFSELFERKVDLGLKRAIRAELRAEILDSAVTIYGA